MDLHSAQCAGVVWPSGTHQTIRLTQDMSFLNCTFEDDMSFSGPWEDTESLRVTFEGDVQFNLSVFLGQARFIGATFQKTAGFDGCTFHHVCAFRDAVFSGRTLFRTVAFEGYVLFNAARFNEEARFMNTCFAKGVNFTGAQFHRRSEFAGVYARGRTVPLIERVRFVHPCSGDDETFWRFMKQVCQEAGLYRQAGECFYNEQCAHFWMRLWGADACRLSAGRKLLRLLWAVRLLPEFVLGRLLFGYGERPMRVLTAAAMIILVCGLFYASPAAHLVSGEQSFEGNVGLLSGLFYSTTTFTTLGLGDLAPHPSSMLTRWVTMLEAFSGAFLIALFVVCFWKRYSRG